MTPARPDWWPGEGRGNPLNARRPRPVDLTTLGGYLVYLFFANGYFIYVCVGMIFINFPSDWETSFALWSLLRPSARVAILNLLRLYTHVMEVASFSNVMHLFYFRVQQFCLRSQNRYCHINWSPWVWINLSCITHSHYHIPATPLSSICDSAYNMAPPGCLRAFLRRWQQRNIKIILSKLQHVV